jgi:hypothetical protein
MNFFDMVFIWISPAVIILMGLFFAVRTNILRDDVRGVGNFDHIPYSLGRVQLFWWSLIVASCFSAHYGLNNGFPDFSGEKDYSLLVLMGISLGTTAAAKVIDNNDMLRNVVRHQESDSSKGFLIDILSDENGISVHRFQAVVFNFIFGLMFISYFIQSGGAFLSLGELELSLMGISSAAYVGLKLNENSGKPVNAPLSSDLSSQTNE